MDSSKIKSIAEFLTIYPDIQKSDKKETKIRSARDEMVDLFVKGINKEREGTKFKPMTHRQIALMLNGNPILGHSITECWQLYKQCQKKGFKMFWWIMKKP